MSTSDKELLLAVFTRHSNEWEKKLGARMSNAFKKRKEPQDILQEAWARIDKRVNRFRIWFDKLPVEKRDLDKMTLVWVRRIVKATYNDIWRECVAKRRDLRRESPLADSVANFTQRLIDSITSPSGRFAYKELLEQISKIVSEMNVSDREILALRLFEQKSSKEVAEFLGLTDITVRKRFSRALQHLVALMPDSIAQMVPLISDSIAQKD